MGTALSTTGNKNHTPCLIGVAISPLNPNAPHLVMGSSAEVKDGVRVRREQCVYSGGVHCISIRTCVCVRLCMCVCASAQGGSRARKRLCLGLCIFAWFGSWCMCNKECVSDKGGLGRGLKADLRA